MLSIYRLPVHFADDQALRVQAVKYAERNLKIYIKYTGYLIQIPTIRIHTRMHDNTLIKQLEEC